jgi:hypothetical protein
MVRFRISSTSHIASVLSGLAVMRLCRASVAVVILLACAIPGLAQKAYFAAEAGKHIGEYATVCGVVADARYAHGAARPG